MDPCNTPETISYARFRVQVSTPLGHRHPKPEALDHLEAPRNFVSRLMIGIRDHCSYHIRGYTGLCCTGFIKETLFNALSQPLIQSQAFVLRPCPICEL